jgi:hypothetical protein
MKPSIALKHGLGSGLAFLGIYGAFLTLFFKSELIALKQAD